MRMRTKVILAGMLATALGAAPAEAKLVYVKNTAGVEPVVYVATDKGNDPRRLGIGRAPTISPDGRWVAFVTVPTNGSAMDAVVLQRLDAGSQRLVMRARSIDSLRFSPDSGSLGAIAACASTTSRPGGCATPPKARSVATRSRPTRSRSSSAGRRERSSRRRAISTPVRSWAAGSCSRSPTSAAR
jgi:hypothetical protein